MSRGSVWSRAQVSDKCSPEELVEMITAFNPDNLPGRLGVVVRMGAMKLRENLPNLIAAVQRSGQVRSAYIQKMFSHPPGPKAR